jgi:hypothetical protein
MSTGASREFGSGTSAWLEMIKHGRILLRCDPVMYAGHAIFACPIISLPG